MEKIEVLSSAEVKDFIGEHRLKHSILDVKNPITSGPLAFTDFYFEQKRSQIEAVRKAKTIIREVQAEFNQRFSKNYDIFEKYLLDDAEVAVVVLGSTAGTVKVVIDELRKKGIKAGLLKIRVFRPFYYQEIQEVLTELKVVAVLDRSDACNSFLGPLGTEIKAALYESPKRPLIANYVYGLGGRDVDISQIKQIFTDLEEIKNTGKIKELVKYLGVRE
jgi:pyruvate ferredoxin oxidoreductase alpha subunit